MLDEPREDIDRRIFVKQSTSAAMLAAGMLAEEIVCTLSVIGANDRIRLCRKLGCGARSQGHVHMAQLASRQMQVETVAVCDLWSLAREHRGRSGQARIQQRSAAIQVLRRDAGA